MAIKVNGEVIPEEAIRFELSRLVQFYSEHMPAEKLKDQIDVLKKKAEEQAVGAKLLIAEANRLDIKVQAPEIDAKLEEMIKRSGGRESFDKMLVAQNLTEDVIRLSIERGRKVDKLVEKISADVGDPTEKEMKEHFDKHAEEYRTPAQVQAQHILIKPDSDSEQDRETARSRLLEIRQQVMEGADFGDQAAAYSDCPSGKRSEGSLGWFSCGVMVEEFDKAVFSMDVGDISEVVETPLGFHLIRKLDEESESDGSFEDSKKNVRDLLRHAKRGEAIAAFVEELKKKAVIERD